MRIRGRARDFVETWRANKGYTLVEVMVFLALTSFLLVTAIATVSGRQQQVQFSQSARDFESKISDIINDVSTGFYPTGGTAACNVNVTGRPVISVGSNQDLGTNEDCLYVGKAIQFSPSPGGASQYWVYNLAGRRKVESGSSIVSSIDEALPVAVAIPSNPSFNDSVEINNLQYGLRVKSVIEVVGATTNRFGTVAVMTNFSGSSPSNGISEGQSVRVGGVRDNSGTNGLNRTKSQAVSVINALTEDSSEPNGYDNTANTGMVVCLIDDGNRKASLTIDANGNTRLDIDGYNTGCDS